MMEVCNKWLLVISGVFICLVDGNRDSVEFDLPSKDKVDTNSVEFGNRATTWKPPGGDGIEFPGSDPRKPSLDGSRINFGENNNNNNIGLGGRYPAGGDGSAVIFPSSNNNDGGKSNEDWGENDDTRKEDSGAAPTLPPGLGPRMGSENEICSLPKDVGTCRMALSRWYFDVGTEDCESFFYGGCQGNENRFSSEEECRDACVENACVMGPGVSRCDLPRVANTCRALVLLIALQRLLK